MSKITNDGGLNPIWHRMLYSCTHMATVGVKGLMYVEPQRTNLGLLVHLSVRWWRHHCHHVAVCTKHVLCWRHKMWWHPPTFSCFSLTILVSVWSDYSDIFDAQHAACSAQRCVVYRSVPGRHSVDSRRPTDSSPTAVATPADSRRNYHRHANSCRRTVQAYTPTSYFQVLDSVTTPPVNELVFLLLWSSCHAKFKVLMTGERSPQEN